MSQQHDAVTGVSCGIGAEIAIGASVSRHQVAGFGVGQPSVGLDDFEGLFGIKAVAPMVVSVYYLCHHVLPRRHPRVISPRDAPSADRASRRTVAQARLAENLSIELLSLESAEAA
jgi:hypothetical protein